MPSKDKARQLTKNKGNEARPFTVFLVNPETPEEVHTDTIMARDCEHALVIAGQRHRSNTILHVRGIGEGEFFSTGINAAVEQTGPKSHFPCARFINGKFHQATFNDDQLLETLFE
jgi:hypothetical protein